MKIWFIVFLALLCAHGARADAIDTVVVPVGGTSQAGGKMLFAVYFHNAAEKIGRVTIPESVDCVLKSVVQDFNVTAYSAEPIHNPSISIQPKSFRKIEYLLEIPPAAEGLFRIEIPAFNNARMTITVDPAATNADGSLSEAPDRDESERLQTLDSIFTLYQPYLGNFGAYQPMYFLVGTDPEKSKFQISFKYRFFNPEGSLAENHPWVNGFHFAYTQTSFWDLAGDSKPFEDTSYKPELFFQTRSIYSGSYGLRRLFIQTGFQHQSNGRGGDLSRSTNFLYFQPIFIFYGERRKWGLGIGPKVWTYVDNNDQTNADLPDYLGYFDLQIKAGKADSIVFDSHFGYAKEGGSMELNLTYPLHKILFSNLDLYFQIQYVNALAESMIDFTERTQAVRIGVAIVR